MTRGNIARITTLGIVLSAGSAFGQVRGTTDDTRQPQRDRQNQPGMDRNEQSQVHLHRANNLLGSKLESRNGDRVGDVEDLIIDRGSGKIVFAVVEVGGVLGIGGKEFAVPYDRLEWSEREERFVTTMTRQEAERQNEFLPEDWKDLRQTSWMDRVTGWRDTGRDDDAREQAIMAATGRTQAEEIRGRVVEIHRHDERTGSDDMTVVIETQDGNRREVILGPSWYTSGHESALLRGQTVVIRAREHNGRYYGWSAGERGNEMMLRNDEGRGIWSRDRDDAQNRDRDANRDRDRNSPQQDRNNRDRNQPAGQPGTRPGATQPGDRTSPTGRTDRMSGADANIHNRYILLSELIGADADARGISSGEIQGALIEARSGRVAFLLFDPNENFLGIADNIYMVPWSVAYINRDMKVNLDADANEIGNAMEVPDDLSTLRSTQAIEPAYRAFQVRPTQFRDRSEGRNGMHRDETDRRNQPDRDRTNPGRQP